MTTIIVGTNRENSKSGEIGKICLEMVSSIKENVGYIDLADISDFGVQKTMYNPEFLSKEIATLQEKYIKPSDKWIVIVPEYNGGIPGIFKLFIDALSIKDKAENFENKEVLLIGVAAGRAGNARGLDYLTNCFNYLGMSVFPGKLPISSINFVLKDEKLDEGTSKVLLGLIQKFLK